MWFSYIVQFIRNKNLSIGLLNAGSLGTRHDEFYAVMGRIASDVVAIN